MRYALCPRFFPTSTVVFGAEQARRLSSWMLSSLDNRNPLEATDYYVHPHSNMRQPERAASVETATAQIVQEQVE